MSAQAANQFLCTPPSIDLMPRSAWLTKPSGASRERQRAFSSPPEMGERVRFQQSPTHHPEIGIVRGRQFGTGIIEITTQDDEQFRLEPSQYEVITDANA